VLSLGIQKKTEEENKKMKTNLIKRSGNLTKRKIILPEKLTEDVEIKEDPTSVGSLSLEFGSKCIRNALFLSKNNNVKPSNNTSNNTTTSSNSSLSSSSTQDDLFRQSILINGCYIALASDNPVLALSYAQDVLEMKKVSDSNRNFADIYAAEAYCMLSKPALAAEHLLPSKFAETVTLPSSYPQSSDEPCTNVRYLLAVNLGIIHSLRDDLTAAQQAISQALQIQQTTRAILIQVYILLRKGNTFAALQILSKINNIRLSTIPKKQ